MSRWMTVIMTDFATVITIVSWVSSLQSALHEVQDNSRSARRHLGPPGRRPRVSLLHLTRLNRNCERWRGPCHPRSELQFDFPPGYSGPDKYPRPGPQWQSILKLNISQPHLLSLVAVFSDTNSQFSILPRTLGQFEICSLCDLQGRMTCLVRILVSLIQSGNLPAMFVPWLTVIFIK